MRRSEAGADGGLLAGSAAFVSGAAQGIGLAVTRAFLSQGASVAMADVQADAVRRAAAALAEEFGERTLALVLDVTDEPATERAADAVVERFGKVDIVVPNAGVLLLRHALDIGLDEWRRVIDVNLTGAFISATVLARRMVAQGGGGAGSSSPRRSSACAAGARTPPTPHRSSAWWGSRSRWRRSSRPRDPGQLRVSGADGHRHDPAALPGAGRARGDLRRGGARGARAPHPRRPPRPPLAARRHLPVPGVAAQRLRHRTVDRRRRGLAGRLIESSESANDLFNLLHKVTEYGYHRKQAEVFTHIMNMVTNESQLNKEQQAKK